MTDESTIASQTDGDPDEPPTEPELRATRNPVYRFFLAVILGSVALTVPEVADILRKSQSWTWEQVWASRIRSFKCGRSVRVSRDALIEYIDAGSSDAV